MLPQTHSPVKRDGVLTGYKVKPTAILCRDGARIVVQEGQFFGTNGDKVYETDLPDWVSEEIGKLKPDRKQALGLGGSKSARKTSQSD